VISINAEDKSATGEVNVGYNHYESLSIIYSRLCELCNIIIANNFSNGHLAGACSTVENVKGSIHKYV